MVTMCKNNSRESAYSGGFIPLQNCIDLIGLSPAIGYYSYTKLALICYWCDFGVLLHQSSSHESSKHIIHGAKQ